MLRKKTKVDLEQVDTTKTRRRIEDALRKSATPKDLVKLADILGVEVAVIPKNPRPCFSPNQVRCVHQIKKGLEYRKMSRQDGKGETVTVLREPFYKTKSVIGWWVEVEYWLAGKLYEGTFSLQDCNIFPYENGTWNETNWLAFTKNSKYLVCSCCHCHCCGHHYC